MKRPQGRWTRPARARLGFGWALLPSLVLVSSPHWGALGAPSPSPTPSPTSSPTPSPTPSPTSSPTPSPTLPSRRAPQTSAGLDKLLPSLSAPPITLRRRACETLQETSPKRLSLYLARLGRHPFHTYTEVQRTLLTQAGVTLPGPSGWFNIPKLKPGERAPADTDMIDALLRRPPPRGGVRQAAYARALETLCLIRGLARMRDLRIAEPLIRFAFTPYGITFRWEVVRAIKSLGSYAVPALLKLTRLRVRDWRSQRTRFLVRRFAYHLQSTMAQTNPQQALAMADRPLQLILLRAYGRFRHADAVEAILSLTNHEDPELRQAARKALLEYFVGKAPRARMKKLKLPGGQESDHVQRLYLSYRGRATHEVRQALERLTSGRYDRSIPGRELVRMLFSEQDRLRATRWSRTLEQALRADRAGRHREAERLAEEILRHAPLLPKRSELFALLERRATRLASKGHLVEAASMLERSALLLGSATRPADARRRRVALADAAYLRALEAEAAGDLKRAVAIHRQALLVWPEHTGARVALLHLSPEPRLDPDFLWALVLLAALGTPGLLLLIGAVRRIRARAE